MRKYGSIRLIVTISMVIAIALFLPALGLAGNLEPSDPPAPTMRTLDEIYSTNSWSQKLQCAQVETIHGLRNICPRFEVLADFNNEAVLDKETGLVWEQSPSNLDWQGVWLNARNFCNEKKTGGSLGWRLPTVQELASLVDSSVVFPGPAIPAGSPFANVQSCRYWSATTMDAQVDLNTGYVYPAHGYAVDFSSGDVVHGRGISENNRVWCVRGGQGADAQ
jgi:hypothetical protein